MDADDVSLPKRFENQVAFFDRAQSTVLLGTDSVEINSKGGLVKINTYPSKHHDLVDNLKKRKRFFSHSSVMFRTDSFKRIGGYNPRFLLSSDCDLWFRLAEYGSIGCLNVPLVKIRQHSLNISKSQGGQTQLLYAMAATICYFLRNKGITDPCACQNDSNWQMFLTWLTPKVEQTGYFVVRDKWKHMRQDYYSQSDNLARWVQLINNIIFSGCACWLIYEKFFGTNLPEILADEWSSK